MACKLTLTLNGKIQKGSVYNLTPQSVLLTLNDIFYRSFKTDDFDLPYISESDIEEIKKSGRYDLIGAVVNGELLDMIVIKFKNDTKRNQNGIE